jgi:glycosyltransferase involved in cell wall biosynthesis
MKKKSILIILPWLPYPLTSGGHQALYNGIVAIHKDMDVSLSFAVEDEYQYLDALEGFSSMLPNVTLYPYYRCKRIADGAKRRKPVKPWYNRLFHAMFPGRHSFDRVRYWKYCTFPPSREWSMHNQQVIDSNHFDFVQIEMPWLLNTVLGLSFDGKKIFVHHELGFVRRAQEMSNTPKEDYDAWTWLRFTDMNEIALLNMYDAIVTLSSTDTEKLKKAGVTRPVYSSMATIDPKTSLTGNALATKRLVFMGPDEHAPNLDGITWFLENCWKKLREQDAQYTLEIIGKWNDTNIKKIKSQYQGVGFCGYVDDLSEAMKGCVMIVPINIGSGIRMKILEAAARGIPFVSTTVGAEGIPVKNGTHCFIADEPESFVQSILKLQDVSLRKQMVENSYQMLRDNFSIDALRANRLDIYDSVGAERSVCG